MGTASSKKSSVRTKRSLETKNSVDSGISSGSSREKPNSGTMPLFRRQSEEAKKKLQHMLFIAKEGPESNFDISGCEISEFPSGVFAICKVLQKEALIAHTNWMSALKGGGNLKDLCYLKVLDLHQNDLTHLPDDIGSLASLQVLNLQDNKLKSLPSSMGNLHNLRILNLKGNKLKSLPVTMCVLPRLHTLNISNNCFTELPKELCQIRTLETLSLDADQMIYPPSDICQKSTESIMSFLCTEFGLEYIPPSKFLAKAMDGKAVSPTEKNFDALAANMAAVNDAVMQYENLKAKKQQERKLLEMQLEEEQCMQTKMASASASKKKDVLDSLTRDQAKVQSELDSLQQVKEEEHKRHIESLREAEANAMNLVSRLMEMNEKANKTEELLEQLEKERMQSEEWFVVRQEEANNIRKQEVLHAMEGILADNKQMSELMENFQAKKTDIVQRAQGEAYEADDQLHSVLNLKQKDQQLLFEELRKMEDLQKEAFETLQVQKDARHQRIAGQIELIEQELAQITALEVENRQLSEGLHKDLLKDKREELTQLLITLIQQRDDREQELKKRMVEMEEQRLDDQMDYWIVQYQRLMDRKPQSLVCQEKLLEFAVVEILENASASDYVHAFARHRITIETLLTLTEDDIRQIGVHEVGVRRAIMIEIEKYRLKEAEAKAAQKLNTLEQETNAAVAPPGPAGATPSAPALDEVVARGVNSECVICMEHRSSVLFLNCGHVCCCSSCSDSVRDCPLCRAQIVRKIRLYFDS